MDFDELYNNHAQMVFATCMTYSRGRRSWAEDATHDVFIKAFERIDQLDPEKDPGPWLYRIAVNHCLSKLRREGSIWERVRKGFIQITNTDANAHTPEKKLQNEETIRKLFRILDELPPMERTAFVMRYLDDKTPKEICEILDISKGYCSKLLSRARKRLEDAL